MDFDVDFQVGILSLMYTDKQFLRYASIHLKPSYFDTKELKWLFITMRNHLRNYDSMISERVVKNYVKRELAAKQLKADQVPAIRDAFSKVVSDNTEDGSYITSEIVEFIKNEAVREAFQKAKDLYEKREFEGIPDVFASALYEASFTHQQGQFYPNVENLESRRTRRNSVTATTPTGISELDSYLRGGGLGVKELGVVLAPPNRGKSMLLKHLAEYAAFILRRRTLLFTLEMSEDRYLDRFDLSLTSTVAAELEDRHEAVLAKISRLQSTHGNVLHVKEYGSKRATVDTLIAYADNLKRQGWAPEFIVVDYADELKAATSYKEERHNLSHIYKELRGWAVNAEIPLWTASQANRSSLKKKIVTMEDIAEDFGKAAIADVILALSQTDNEFKENVMRLYIAKNRDSASKLEVKLATNFYLGRMYDPIGDDLAELY